MNKLIPRLPAEWEPQSGVMLTWPHPLGDWAPFLSEVEPVYVRIACAILEREDLLVVAHDEGHRHHIKDLLLRNDAKLSGLHLYVLPSNDSWSRDHGPITIYQGEQPRLLDFIFNGWGGKFDASLDTQINQGLSKLGAFQGAEMDSLAVIMEGGSIDTDGHGTLLTTRHCLMTPTRNPRMSQRDWETMFAEHMGITRVLWLSEGKLEGDDTDSHIDMLARFCNPTTIAYSTCDDPQDPHYQPLQRMLQELEAFHTPDGQPYELIPLPIPTAILSDEGKRLPGSYANFLIINGAVLLPIYGDEHDEIAVSRITACFPRHKVIPINCRPLIHQYGSLHCITMQLPKGTLS